MKTLLFIISIICFVAVGFGQSYIDGPTGVYGAQYNPATTISSNGNVTVGTGGNWGFAGTITSAAKTTAAGATHGITFTGSGTYSNAGATPMIDGYATSNGLAMVLPVSAGGQVRGITTPAGSTTTAAWFGSDASTTQDPTDGSTHTVNRSSVDPSVNGVSQQGFWDVVNSGSGSYSVSMPDMSTEAAQASDIRILGWNGSMWTVLDPAAPSALTAGTPVTATVPAGITAVTFGTLAYLLPVTLISFNASKAGDCAATLQWKAGTEINSSKYTIQYSNGNGSYSDVASVASKNSSTGAAYTYTVSNLTNGAALFRLKMADKNGATAYSDSRSLAIDCVNGKIIVLQNPIKNRITIKGITGINSQVRVYSIEGKLLASKVTSNAIENINATSFAAGTYLVTVTDAKGNNLGKVKVVK